MVFAQIYLPYVPCRFPTCESTTSFLGYFITLTVLVPQNATALMKSAEPHLTCFQSVEVSDACGLLSKGAGKDKSLVKGTTLLSMLNRAYENTNTVRSILQGNG